MNNELEDKDRFYKTFLLLMCATEPGEAIAARDALLRLSGLNPHELALTMFKKLPKNKLTNQQKASQILYAYSLKEIYLSERELAFIRDMLVWSNPSERQLEWLEKIYTRVIK